MENTSDISFQKTEGQPSKKNEKTAPSSQKAHMRMPDGTSKTSKISRVVKNENSSKVDKIVEKLDKLSTREILKNVSPKESEDIREIVKDPSIERMLDGLKKETPSEIFKNVMTGESEDIKEVVKDPHIERMLDGLHQDKKEEDDIQAKRAKTSPNEPSWETRKPRRGTNKKPLLASERATKENASILYEKAKGNFEWNASEEVKNKTSKVLKEIYETEKSLQKNLSVLTEKTTWDLKTRFSRKGFTGTYLEALIASGAYSDKDKELISTYQKAFDQVLQSSKLISDELSKTEGMEPKAKMAATLEIFMSKEMEKHIENMVKVATLYDPITRMKPRNPKALLYIQQKFLSTSPSGFQSIIIQPVQRVPRYQLLMETLRNSALGKGEDLEKNKETVQPLLDASIIRMRALTQAMNEKL